MSHEPAPHTPRRPGRFGRRRAVVSGLPSDAHTWNLIFLQLCLEDAGFEVVNLGPCVTPERLVGCCQAHDPVLVVLSSVNGHGYQDGLATISVLRATPELAGIPVVIGGKLTTSGALTAARVAALEAAGYNGVYDDRPDAAALFSRMISELSAPVS